MNRTILAPLTMLALAACNNQPSVSLTNASGEEVAKAVAESGGGGAAVLRAGQWETTAEVLEAEIPGIPAAARDQMTKSQIKTTSYCMTPEEAKAPKGDFLSGESGGNCTYSNFTMAGGRIESTMRCTGPDGSESAVVEMNGTFTPEAIAAESSMTMGGERGMKMRVKIASKRVGDCPS